MIGQQHQVLVKTDDHRAIAPVWRTKIGSERALVLGCYVDGALATVTTPALHIRRPDDSPDDALTIGLSVLADDDDHNLQTLVMGELAAGRYIAEVRGTVGGAALVFPDSGYLVIEVLAGAGA